jgi:hypothetical protein
MGGHSHTPSQDSRARRCILRSLRHSVNVGSGSTPDLPHISGIVLDAATTDRRHSFLASVLPQGRAKQKRNVQSYFCSCSNFAILRYPGKTQHHDFTKSNRFIQYAGQCSRHCRGRVLTGFASDRDMQRLTLSKAWSAKLSALGFGSSTSAAHRPLGELEKTDGKSGDDHPGIA